VTDMQEGRKPKDRDFLRTREGMFFCVTGYLHPPDRYTAYLKYSPASSGKWRDTGTAYKRELPYYHVRSVEETVRYLEEHYPWYVTSCPVRNIRFSMVPREYVARYYDPQERLREILAHPVDSLGEEVRGLATEIAESADVPLGDLGITGSILIGLHNPTFSDIDLVVYGRQSARRVRQALREGTGAGGRIRELGTAFIEQWSRGIAERFPLTVDEARYLARRRWNYGWYGERYFSIHPIRTDDEITEHYGDHVYRGQGAARIRATLVGTSDALFMPAGYLVADVEVVEGPAEAADVREVVSYEGLYRDVADVGQEIEAKGNVERVDAGIDPDRLRSAASEAVRRLVIGTSALQGEGYIRPFPGGDRADADVRSLEG
jgi:predicted nucleotidyltransferase